MAKVDNKQETIWLLILKHWIPPLIAAVLGLFTGIYMTKAGNVSAEKQLYLTHRVQQAEAVAIHFDEYIENWRRLIQIATYEKEKGNLGKDETKRKNDFVAARNIARDKLFGALGALSLYFGPKVLREVDAFRRWDDGQTIKRLEELPSLTEWRSRKEAVVSAIRNELEDHL